MVLTSNKLYLIFLAWLTRAAACASGGGVEGVGGGGVVEYLIRNKSEFLNIPR